MKRKLFRLICLALAVTLCLGGCVWTTNDPGVEVKPDIVPPSGPLAGDADPGLTDADPTFSAQSLTYQQAYEILDQYREDLVIRDDAAVDLEVEEAVPETGANSSADAGTGSGSSDYTDTNVQVEGVDEGDLMKTDGEYIYYLQNGQELLVYRAQNGAPQLLTTLSVGEYTEEKDEESYTYRNLHISELYLLGDRLVLLGNFYEEQMSAEEGWYNRLSSSSRVLLSVYDVSDPARPVLLEKLGQDGDILSSRRVGSRLYLVSRYWVYDPVDGQPETFIPRLYTDERSTVAEESCLCIPSEISSNSWTVVSCYDLDSLEELGTVCVLGAGSTVYMNTENLYIAASRYLNEAQPSYTEDGHTVTPYIGSVRTDLMRFRLEKDGSISLAATGSVPGYLLNQFSLDEYAGYLRVVTTLDETRYLEYTDGEQSFVNAVDFESKSTNGLYVLSSELEIVGKVDDLAQDEWVYSVRFMGEYGYFVTFRQTDPLFCVDLRDPANPTIRSQLKIPGFSQYLHPMGSGQLLGLGMQADENTGATTCMKLSMFDISDPTAVTERSVLELDAYWSDALYDHHAVLADAQRRIVGFAAEDTYYLYRYDPYGEKFISVVKLDLGEYVWNVRAAIIGDWLYICTPYGIHTTLWAPDAIPVPQQPVAAD